MSLILALDGIDGKDLLMVSAYTYRASVGRKISPHSNKQHSYIFFHCSCQLDKLQVIEDDDSVEPTPVEATDAVA
jgi:hypothetical protein